MSRGGYVVFALIVGVVLTIMNLEHAGSRGGSSRGWSSGGSGSSGGGGWSSGGGGHK